MRAKKIRGVKRSGRSTDFDFKNDTVLASKMHNHIESISFILHPICFQPLAPYHSYLSDSVTPS